MARADRFDGHGMPDESPAMRVGQDLRIARERHGWALEAVSDHLRIRLPYLQAIEEGRPEDLPGGAYAVGFVRTYAKALDLDPDEIGRRFRAEGGDVARKTELTFPAPVPERGVPALAVVAVGVILVIGAYAAWYRMTGDRHPGPEAVQVVPDRLVPLVPERPPVAAPGPVAAVEPAPEPAEAPAEAPPEMASVSPSQAAAAALPVPPQSALASHIVVRAKTNSWILVKDGHGQVVLNRVLQAGESWPVPDRAATSSLLLTTGNAGGTELLVDGVVTASLGGDGSVRRDLPLDASAIRDGKLAAPATAAPVLRASPRNQ